MLSTFIVTRQLFFFLLLACVMASENSTSSNSEDKLQELEKKHQNLTIEYENLKTELQNLTMEHQQLKELFKKFECAGATDEISFSATRKSELGNQYDSRSDKVVNYENVKDNKGNGLNQRTGIFTVPKTGTYKFTFYAEVNPRYYHLVLMKKNDMVIENAYSMEDPKGSYSYFKPISMSTVQYLHTNDTIWNYLVYGYLIKTEFSGIRVEKFYERCV